MYWNTLRLRQKPLKFVSNNSIDNELSGGTWADDDQIHYHIYVSLGLNSFIYFLVYFNPSLVVFNICRFLMNDLQYTCGSFILELTWKSILWYMKLYTKTCPCKWYVIWYVMMTSSNGTISALLGPLCGECTGHRWIPPQRPVTRSFGVFFYLRLNKQLRKQLWGWWFETPSRPLWRHCNVRQDNISYYMRTLLPEAGISGRDE